MIITHVTSASLNTTRKEIIAPNVKSLAINLKVKNYAWLAFLAIFTTSRTSAKFVNKDVYNAIIYSAQPVSQGFSNHIYSKNAQSAKYKIVRLAQIWKAVKVATMDFNYKHIKIKQFVSDVEQVNPQDAWFVNHSLFALHVFKVFSWMGKNVYSQTMII